MSFRKGTLQLLVVMLAWAGVITPGDHQAAHAEDTVVGQVLPQSYLRRFDPITVIFNKAIGPKTSQIAKNGQDLLRIRPFRPGVYRWLDSKTLEFRPSASWPAYARVMITLDKAKIPGMTQSYSVTRRTLLPGPVMVTPAKDERLKADIKQIYLGFARALPLQSLKQALSIQLSQLGAGRSKRLGADQWWLKALPTPRQNNHKAGYLLLLKQPLPKARVATIKLKLSLPSAKGTTIPVWTSHFRTVVPFRVLAIYCHKSRYTLSWGRNVYPQDRALDCGGGYAVPTLELSHPVDTKRNPSSLRQHIKFSPAVAGLQLQYKGKDVLLKGRFRRDTLYRLTISAAGPSVFDTKGQVLRHKGEQTVYFYLRQKQPFLRWRTGQGMVEFKGPKMMPIHVRSIRKADLRVYPLAAKSRLLWPFPKRPVQLDETQTPPTTGQPTKGPQQAITKAIRTLPTPAFSGLIDLPLLPKGQGMYAGLDLGPYLKPLLKQGKGSNQFLIGIRLLNGSKVRRYVRVQVTDLSLTAVEESDKVRFVVTSIRNAQPVAKAHILIEGPKHPKATKWSVLWQGHTDAKGMVQITKQIVGTPMRVRVQKGQDALLLDPMSPPPAMVRYHWSTSNQWLSWLHKDKPTPKTNALRAHLFTERPVYKPGEEVHIKGMVRIMKQGRLSIPEAQRGLRLRIRGPRGKQWDVEPIKLSKVGSFYHKFQPKNPTSGIYKMTLLLAQTDGSLQELHTRSFEYKSYKLPLFEVNILGKSAVPADKPFQISVMAKYYAGGLVTRQPVRWRVTERTILYRPEGRKGYTFRSNIRYGRRSRSRSRLLLERTGQLNAKGQASLKLDPTKSFDLRARRYVIEADIEGPDRRHVSGYKVIKVLPPFSVGVRLEKRFGRSTGPIKPKLIAVGHEGKLVSQIPLQVRLYRREWHAHLVQTDFVQGQAKYRTEVVDRLVARCHVNTGQTPASCPLNAKKGGVYVLKVQARDRMGRLQRVEMDLFVQGKQRIAWERPRGVRFKVSPSKKLYRVGETAQLLIRSPFQEAKALVIIEDPEGTRYQWLSIKGGKGLFSMPIERRHTPSFPVHVVLMRGRVAKPMKTGLDPGRPKTAIASTTIKVDPRANRIMLAMSLPKRAEPRQVVEVALKMTSPQGKPLSGEVTLWAVDRAALSLGKEGRLHPLGAFVLPKRPSVRVRDSRNMVIGRIATLADRSGGGGGADAGQRLVVRRNFKTVPYYNPAIQVGPSGRVKVRIRLFDDLTTYAIRAVATSGPGRFGFTAKNLQVQLPVMVQSTLPRFVRPGDTLQTGGIARVVRGKAGAATAQIKVSGLTMQTPATKGFTLEKNKATALSFGLSTPLRSKGNVSVQLSVRRIADNKGDAFQIKLPVRPDRSRIYLFKERRFRSLAQVMKLSWPEPIRPGSGRVDILLATRNETIKAAAAMQYLLQYPYGCIEQQVSRAYPMLVLKDTLSTFAMRSMTNSDFNKAIKSTLRALAQRTKRDGTIGYWPNSSSSMWLTAYAARFLNEAIRLGFVYPEYKWAMTQRALRRSLRSDFGWQRGGQHALARAEALLTLAQIGDHEPAYLRRMVAQSRKLSLYTKTRLLLAMAKDPIRHASRIKRLTRSLRRLVRYRNTRRGPVFLGIRRWKPRRHDASLNHPTRTLAALLEALAAVSPRAKQVKALHNALLSRRRWTQDGRGRSWGSTQNNARVLLALRSYLKAKGTTPRRTIFAFRIGNKQEGKLQWSSFKSKASHKVWADSYATDAPVAFALMSMPKRRPLWVQLRLSYIPKTPGAKAMSRNKGLVIQRETSVLQKKGNRHFRVVAGTRQQVKAGQVLEEEVRLLTAKGLHQVAVEVPIASGLSLLDPTLLTASSVAKATKEGSFKPSHVEYLDDRVRYFFDWLPAGEHKLYFRARALTPGQYQYPPASAQQMYRPSISGQSPGYTLVIENK